MANRRSISRSISVSEQVDMLSDRAALLFTWMLPHADDYGRLPGSVKKLAAIVVPMRTGRPGWTYDDIERYLDEMAAAVDEEGLPLIYRYRTESGVSVIQLVKFDEHQDGLHKRTRSKFPDPPEPFPTFPGNSGKVQESPEISREVQEIPASRARAEGKGNEQKRNEGKGEGKEEPAPPRLEKEISDILGRDLTTPERVQLTQLSYTPDLILEAARRAVERGKPRLSYVRGILSDWTAAGLTTLDAVMEADPPGKTKPPAPGKPRDKPMNEKEKALLQTLYMS